MKIPFLSNWLAGHRLEMAWRRHLQPVRLSRDVKNALDDAVEAAVNVWLNRRRGTLEAYWRGEASGAFVEELALGHVFLMPPDKLIVRWKLLHSIIGDAIEDEYSRAMDPYRPNPYDRNLGQHERAIDAAAKKIAKELARVGITMQIARPIKIVEGERTEI